jgi:outer membrane biosynthesis protein TonB
VSAASHDGMSLRAPIAVSAALHLVVMALFLLARGAPRVSLPPTYKVSLVAAAPGPRQIGVVQPTPAAVAPTPTPAPVSRAVPDPSRMKTPPVKAPVKPVKVAKVATPSATPAAAPAKAAPAPVAGGGPQGGRGADVANVQISGTNFPYPEYLQNVVRQIALRFKPPGGRELRADVAFLIRRDGSVTGIRLTTRSGVYAFDTEAMGAVDAAAGARAFGPLPPGFPDDVLPVTFSFDPRLIR